MFQLISKHLFIYLKFQSISKDSILECVPVRDFISSLVKTNIEENSVNARVDFLACNISQHADTVQISRDIEEIAGVILIICSKSMEKDRFKIILRKQLQKYFWRFYPLTWMS